MRFRRCSKGMKIERILASSLAHERLLVFEKYTGTSVESSQELSSDANSSCEPGYTQQTETIENEGHIYMPNLP